MLVLLLEVFLADEMFDHGWMFKVDSVFSLVPPFMAGTRTEQIQEQEKNVLSSQVLICESNKSNKTK